MASKSSKNEDGNSTVDGSRKSFGKVISKFVDKTSMQGVGYIKDSKAITAKVVWSFLLICALVVMSLHLYLLVSNFISWPKKTTLSLGFSNLKLPSVTVCNVNVFQYSRRDQTTQLLQNLLQRVNPANFDKSKSGTDITDDPGDNEDTDVSTTAHPSNNGLTDASTTADSGSNGNMDASTTADPGNNIDTGTTLDPGDIETGATVHPDEEVDTDTGATVNPDEDVDIETGATADPDEDIDTGETVDPNEDVDIDTDTTDDPGENGNDVKRRKKRFLDDVDDVVNDTIDEYKNKHTHHDDDIEISGAHDAIFVIRNQFTDYFQDLDRDTRIAIGHDIESMLVRCNFKGIQCFSENFTVTQDPHYGNCFTLDSSKLLIKNAGPSYGLTLVLYLRTHEYLPGITTGYGARLHLHHPHTIPFPSSSGTFLEASRETHIAIKQTHIQRIGQPHGKCEDGIQFKAIYGKQYTRQSCQYLCKSSTMIEECGCYDEDDDEIFYSLPGQKVKACSYEPPQVDCMLNVTDRHLSKTLTCECLEPCMETIYTSTISAREWPTDDYSVLLREAICEDYPEDCKLIRAMSKDDLRRNFLKLKIYYEDLNYESIKEEADIEPSQFASDVGGAIGLWIGLSMLSMFEVIQLLYEILEYFFYYKLCKMSQKQSNNSDTTDNTDTNTAKNGPTFDNKHYSSYYNEFENDRSSTISKTAMWETSPEFPSYHFYRGSS